VRLEPTQILDEQEQAVTGTQEARIARGTLAGHRLAVERGAVATAEVAHVKAALEPHLGVATRQAAIVEHDRSDGTTPHEQRRGAERDRVEPRDTGGEHEDEAGDGVKAPEPKTGGRKPEPAGKKAAPAEPKAPEPARPATPRPIDKEKQKAQKRLERKVTEAEAKVGELEAKLAALALELAAMDPADWQAFSARLDAQKGLETELAYAMGEWEEAQAELEKTAG